ncbi:TetR/AcrR family transcriptional regulator [Paenibacillaceae bacterium]|nr:TetR/AcrR family transcriptional regulator [Paenibacillaceae bacterium]
MTTQPEQDIKFRILLAARNLFASQGYEGTSVRQICEQAGANVSLISYHFGGKEKVFEALFDNYLPMKAVLAFEPGSRPPVEELRMIIGEIVKFTVENQEMSNIVQQEMTLESVRTDMVKSFLHPVWSVVKQILVLGRDQRVFQIDSINHALLFVMGATLSYKMAPKHQVLLDGKIPSVEEISVSITRFIVRGLGVADA